MATNPVFNRINKETGYAGFGPQQGQPQRAPQQPMGYPGASETMTPQQLEQMYQQAPAGPVQTGRVTLDDVIMKSLALFALVLVSGAATWFLVGAQPGIAMPVWLLGMAGSLGLSFVIAFSKKVNVPVILGHAVLQGLFIGAVSVTFEAAWPGIVSTAVVATLATFAGMFIGWKMGFIKVTDKSRRIFGMAAIGYLVFLLINLGASFMGFGDGWGIFGSQFGWLIALLGVGLASYSLAVDFDTVDRAVAAGAPQQYSWLMGHGLIASLVWLYIEFLRLFAILNRE
jgi:uncharacterized YccA/Bax inhibitor family protein